MTEIVEGKILQVMESWPLQLVVDLPTGPLDVLLSDDVVVMEEGRSAGPTALSPGGRIRLIGSSSSKTSFLASKITILSE